MSWTLLWDAFQPGDLGKERRRPPLEEVDRLEQVGSVACPWYCVSSCGSFYLVLRAISRYSGVVQALSRKVAPESKLPAMVLPMILPLSC